MISTMSNPIAPSLEAQKCFDAIVGRYHLEDTKKRNELLIETGSLDDIKWCADTFLGDAAWDDTLIHWYGIVHQHSAALTSLDGMGPWWSHIWMTATKRKDQSLWCRLFDVDIKAIVRHVQFNPRDDITHSFIVTPTACYGLSVLVDHGEGALWDAAMDVLDRHRLTPNDPLAESVNQRITMLRHIARTHAISQGREDVAVMELQRHTVEKSPDLALTMMAWSLAAGKVRVAKAVWQTAQQKGWDENILKQTADAVMWLLEDPHAVGVAQAMDVVVLDWMVSHTPQEKISAEVEHMIAGLGTWPTALQQAAPHLTALRCRHALLAHAAEGCGEKERAM